MDSAGSAPEAGHTSCGNINKTCKDCLVALTTENAAKKNATSYRNQCKKCRSKAVLKSLVGNPKRQSYMRDYIRRTGKVKEYPCETCSTSCYKKYAHAFCSDICRFMAYVKTSDTCWIWIGAKKRNGYGKFSMQGKKWLIASRASYEIFKGKIAEGMFICHLCDIPSCVNPEHLWAGTHVENTMDMVDKGRQSSKLSPLDVLKIRRLWEQGFSNASLCEKFGITSGAVSSIIHRRIWKHI